ncbi:acyltransferase family protein [Montanilutibacter psychrotolerans]|uniref:Acyltransferase n=1 Tax=Montanilutibacter psychrotolerans TaxID=1327343 RepID=A0A3M8SUH8_9GAMM|nr:acyltransferase family protein [Lysobacter psychrotolerans]RNF84355.1 acyltransferase [Lysobacter psychrotolerans]
MTNGTGFRLDIQGLRAIAVLLVLVFHVWPTGLPGGYVGVDVFFVISGFLITGLLVREFENKGRISLVGFYARRIRRLLPAATLTLAAAAIGSYLWLPEALWSDLAMEVLASGFYVENLLLVVKSVDYLALQEAPSPVQHYWSLSVEEQFYIFWPLLMIATGALARKMGWRTRAVFAAALGSVTLASFAWGVYKSYTDPAPGYFLTTTRIWELGIGGLLSLMAFDEGGNRLARGVAGWAGCLAILASGYFYTTGLPFPGYEALLPTLGAAALIYARSEPSDLLGRALAVRPLQYFGDISYSLYLWHWPVVVFYPYVTGREIGRFSDGVTVVVVSVVLAHLSKYGVEDRFRHPVAATGRSSGYKLAYAMGAGCMLLVAAAAAVPYGSAMKLDSGYAAPLSQVDASYPGAEAFLHQLPVPKVAASLPAPGVAKLDRGPAYGGNGEKNCIGSTVDDAIAFCNYGKADGRFHLVVIGDSHAVHWLPAFKKLADERGWRLTGLTKSSCAITDVTVRFGSRSSTREFEECTRWNRKMIDWVLANKPDLVVVSMSPNHKIQNREAPDSQEAIAQGLVRELRNLTNAGIDVAMIKHTPWQLEDPPSCMSKPGATVEACSGRRSQVILEGAVVLASRLDNRLSLLDFDDAFCQGDVCPVVIGNVFVHRDKNHLTATYARSLAPALLDRIRRTHPGVP